MLIWNIVAQSPTNRLPLAAGVSRGINGKRKLPPGFPPVYSPAASSMPANSMPQSTNFLFEKRLCRHGIPVQSREPNFTVNNFAGLLHSIALHRFLCL